MSTHGVACATTVFAFTAPGHTESRRDDDASHDPPGSVSAAFDVGGPLVTAGATSAVVQVGHMDANVAEKSARQIFATVRSVFVYDMDGAGNQINIATRGLDPHRSWELDVKQASVRVNSDPYGYPTTHDSPLMESMERIQLVRGTAARQYGSQFGEAASLHAFTSTAYFDAAYRAGMIDDRRVHRSLHGNRVEGVPARISRNGLTATGAKRRVPAYTLLDFSGPGVWPSDDRSLRATVELSV